MKKNNNTNHVGIQVRSGRNNKMYYNIETVLIDVCILDV